LLEWIKDEKGRYLATDPDNGMRYRVSGTAPCELVVLPPASRRSCERSRHANLDTAFQAAEDRRLHERELELLQRTRRQSRARTPWGTARSCTDHGDGVLLYSTAEQDGFHLSPEANAAMPDELRLSDGWYQEDGDGARVILAMPHLFTSLERRDAEMIAEEVFPDALHSWRNEVPSFRV